MKVLIFTSKNESGNAVFNSIRKKFPHFEIRVLKDIGSNRNDLLKSRIKKFGYIKVINQLMFQIIIVKFLKLIYQKRIEYLKSLIDYEEIPFYHVHEVININHVSILNYISNFKPDLVLVSGTRIIKKHILSEIYCPILNIHAGITPEYRGVHGMYWALVNGEPELAGVTLHLVDSGIDTGLIINQKVCEFTKNDCFVTYPFIQLKDSLNLIDNYLTCSESNRIVSNGQKRNLLYHPTLTFYIKNFLLKGIK